MRFLGLCLLFAGALLSGSPVGVLSQTPSLCQTVATGAQLELGNFPGLSTATINLPAGVTLPAQLQSCISPTSSTGQILAVVFQVLKTQGTTYNPDTTVWAAAGWPTPAVRIPTVAEYGMFVSMAGTLGIVSATSGAGAGSGTINIGVGTGATGNLNPALVPACAGQTVQYCETYCSNPANTAACLQGFLGGLLSGLGSLSGINVVVGGGTGGSGNGLNPPPFIPPNINDILRQYQAAAGPLGICSVSCPNNLMCIGSRCIPPQPLCNPPCTGGQFCRPQLNAASLATFNANAAAGAYASQSQGSAGAQGSISVNDAQIMPGGIVSGTCVSFTPVCNSTSCPSGQVCAPFDGCKPCAACGNVTGVDLTPLMAGGFDPSQLTGNFTLPPGQNPGQGQQIAAGIIAQIQGGTSQYGTVVFGASAGSSASTGDAATAVAGGARASADSLLANIRDAALQLGADAQFVANQIRVAVNSTLEVVLAAQNSQASASSSVAINGPLVIRGPGAQVDPNNFTPQGVFNFPPSSSGNTVGGGAVVNAAGGVGLTGDLGSLTLSINAIASAAAAVAVPAGQWLRSSGQVLGGAAQVIVQGILELHNSAFQPAVTVTGSGNVTVSVGSTGNFSCGSLAIQAGGKLDLWSSGGSTYFANFTRCDASALIRIRVASIASLKTSGGSGIAFGYGAVNSTVKASLRCGAQLYDGTDSITLTNPNAANPNTGRRLLAAGDGSQITFQAQSAVYTVPSSSGGSNSVSAVAPAAGLVVVILATIVAILA